MAIVLAGFSDGACIVIMVLNMPHPMSILCLHNMAYYTLIIMHTTMHCFSYQKLWV
jgi:predicted esterase